MEARDIGAGITVEDCIGSGRDHRHSAGVLFPHGNADFGRKDEPEAEEAMCFEDVLGDGDGDGEGAVEHEDCGEEGELDVSERDLLAIMLAHGAEAAPRRASAFDRLLCAGLVARPPKGW